MTDPNRPSNDISEIENTWMVLSDGCRLAVRLWLPQDAERHPVPAVFEYFPYRKRDATAERDAINHAYFAANGYAGVRVDMQGIVLRAKELDVEIAVGTDAGTNFNYQGNKAAEIVYFVEHEIMSPSEALTCATLTAAPTIQMDHRGG